MTAPEPKRRPGRPPLDQPRRHTIRYRITDDELAVLNAAATVEGKTVTDFARDRALAAAKRTR